MTALPCRRKKAACCPFSQPSMLVRPHLAYHDYEGVALNHDERERIDC
jgi:hypothetical protein